MKKSIIISLFALLISGVSFAQEAEKQTTERKAPTVEQIAKRRTDMMRQQYLLGGDQYDKVYKLCLKQVKKEQARREEMKKEREQMNNEMKGILNDAQWERYEKMQKRPQFQPGKQPMRHPNWNNQCPCRRAQCPLQRVAPKMQHNNKKLQMQKGPQIAKLQGKSNNAVIEKKEVENK